MQEKLKNLLLSVATVVLCLMAVEVGLRALGHLDNRGLLTAETDLDAVVPPTDGSARLGHIIRRSRNPRIIYELKPGITTLYHDAPLTINANGFRGPAYPVEKPADVVRIVGIGDSLMFGFGVGDGECYLARLETRLNELAGGPFVQVINTSVPGYNTVMEVETLREKGLAFEPDLVLIQFVFNDIELPNFIRPRVPIFARDRLFLNDFLRRRLMGADEGASPGHRPDGLEPVDKATRDAEVPEQYRDLAGWDAFADALAELRRLAEGRFAVGAIVMAPHSGGRTEEMARLAEQQGFTVLWVRTAFRQYLRSEGFDRYLGSPLSLSATDGHPSALGHAIAAEWLAEAILKEGLIELPSAGMARTIDQSSPSASSRLW